MGEQTRGHLVIIGGHEKRRGHAAILQRVAELAGGQEGLLVICTVASADPEAAASMYDGVFEELGLAEVRFLHLRQREDAYRDEVRRMLEHASGLFFTGGDQLRITSILGGTPVGEQVKRRWRQGAVVAGTSAGAAMMSETMIVGGRGEAAPKLCTIQMAPGMGLLRGAVIDQHFAQRGRMGRLMSALAQNPAVLGIGIDEDTAIEVGADDTLTVVGSQTVTLLDGSDVSFTNASESAPDEPLALYGLRVHVLPQGGRFDLKRRQPVASVDTGKAVRLGKRRGEQHENRLVARV